MPFNIDELTIGEAKKLAALFGTGAIPTASAKTDHGMAMVVADRGHVWVGKVVTDDDWGYYRRRSDHSRLGYESRHERADQRAAFGNEDGCSGRSKGLAQGHHCDHSCGGGKMERRVTTLDGSGYGFGFG